MKKSLLALAVLGAFAGVVQAQTNVVVYGQMDVQIDKASNRTTAMRAGDNNKLGFKGTEDLGNGLKALFQAEIRFDPDTGTTEAGGGRPLFQGQSRVGLAGDFGMIRLGRGLTAVQESAGAYEPWSEDRSRAALTSFIVANYNSDPLGGALSSGNRWSNGIFYNSPIIGGGFQFNGTLATKEALGTGTPTAMPYSLDGTYNNGPISAMIGYERNAIQTKFWNMGASYQVMPALKLMGHYSQQDQGATKAINAKTKGWLLGANYSTGTGMLLAGYGQIKPDAVSSTKQFSIGYEHTMSKRTFLYVDAYNNKSPAAGSINSLDLGIHHSF